MLIVCLSHGHARLEGTTSGYLPGLTPARSPRLRPGLFSVHATGLELPTLPTKLRSYTPCQRHGALATASRLLKPYSLPWLAGPST